MFDFNIKANGIFAHGFKDRSGLPVGDTFVYRLRAKILGRIGRNFTSDENARFASKYSSAEMAAIMNDDPMAPHVRVEFDRNYYGGDYTKVGEKLLVPAALVDLLAGDVAAAFEMAHDIDRVHVIQYESDELYDADGEPLNELAEAPAA